MRVSSEAEMLQFGHDFAQQLDLPAIIELVGDVGTGKTTFTRGLATGLGISEPVTSPSFTISKRYAFLLPSECCKNVSLRESQKRSFYDQASAAFSRHSRENDNTQCYGELIHYDFYRLDDPGIMRDELSDSVDQPNSVIVVEWGGGVADLLPDSKYRLEISRPSESERELKIIHQGEDITDLWKTCGKLHKICGKTVENTTPEGN